MEARIPDPVASSWTGGLAVPLSSLSKWAVENPMAFSGLWFGAAAAFLVGQALIFLPALVAEARAIGGPAAWQWGAFALAYVYIAPPLLALVLVELSSAGRSSCRDCPDGWAPAVRGAAVGVGSLVAWLSDRHRVAEVDVRRRSAGGREAPPGAAEAAALVLLPVPFLIVAAVGAIAGFLLHALVPESRTRRLRIGQQERRKYTPGGRTGRPRKESLARQPDGRILWNDHRSQDPGSPAVADAAPVQAWRAWAGCGDGGQVHLIIDPPAQQVWLLPADDIHYDPRSMQ